MDSGQLDAGWHGRRSASDAFRSVPDQLEHRQRQDRTSGHTNCGLVARKHAEPPAQQLERCEL